MDIYFLLGLNTNTTFFAYIFSDLSIGNSLDWFPCFPTSFFFFFFFFLLFAFWAFLGTTSAPSSLILYICPAPVLEPVISPRSPGSFHCTMILKTKIWVLGVFIDDGFFFSFSFFLPHLQLFEVPGPGIKLAPQQWPELLQWQHQILKLLYHRRTPIF